MSSFDSMKNILERTGIYKVNYDNNIGKELRAYSVGIDSVFSDIDILQREIFISSAQSYGLSEREKFLCREQSSDTLLKRRNILLASERIRNCCTVSDFENLLRSYGLSDFNISENFSAQTTTITVRDTLSNDEKSDLEKRAVDDFPVHLNLRFVYNN